MNLQNIKRFNDDSLKDIAERVRQYGSDHGIKIIASRVYTNRFSDDTVGCRITIPASHVDDALSHRIWPKEVKCRRWKKRTHGADGNFHGADGYSGGGDGNSHGADGNSHATESGSRH